MDSGIMLIEDQTTLSVICCNKSTKDWKNIRQLKIEKKRIQLISKKFQGSISVAGKHYNSTAITINDVEC